MFIVGIIICISLIVGPIVAIIWISFSSDFISKNKIGRNHCGIVISGSSGGDIRFDEMSETEFLSFLNYCFKTYRNNITFNEGHTAEFRIFTNRIGNVKTIGYITSEKVVFEGREYYFPIEE